MRPVINPVFPIEAIASVDELMSIAVGMEHEAALRYEQLAERMRQRGDEEMHALFLRMATLERDHLNGIGRWAAREGRTAPQPAHFAWSLPETFDEADAAGLTPYRALGIAVRNEERAFSFYAYMAALAPDDDVRNRAEALAREELEHVNQLRRLRRRAFHMDRPMVASAGRVRSAAELSQMAAGLGWGSRQAADCAAAALDRTGEGDLATVARRAAPDAPPHSGPAGRSVEGARAAGLLAPCALTAEGALALALRDAEEVAEVYMAVAEQAPDEEVLRHAQELAEQSAGHAALLRTMRDEHTRRKRPGSAGE
jgi:rubrerythrin